MQQPQPGKTESYHPNESISNFGNVSHVSAGTPGVLYPPILQPPLPLCWGMVHADAQHPPDSVSHQQVLE